MEIFKETSNLMWLGEQEIGQAGHKLQINNKLDLTKEFN